MAIHVNIKLEIENKLIEQSIEITEYINNMVNRYINFTNICHYANTYTKEICERHHILPRSLYPDYINFASHPWNLSRLTLRQHIIAHVMLHHIFGGKMSFALNRMCKKQNGLYNRLYESTKLSYLNSEECKINAKKGGKSTKEKLEEGMRIYYKDGISYGLMHEEDPRITAMNLTKVNNTTNKIKQQKEWGYNTSRLNIGTIMYNNGTIQKKFKKGDIVPDGWIKGGLRKYSKFYIMESLLKNNIPNDPEFNRAIRFYGIDTSYYKSLYERCHDKIFRDILYEDIKDYSIIADILNIELTECYALYMDKSLLLQFIKDGNDLCDVLNLNKREVNVLLQTWGIPVIVHNSSMKTPVDFSQRIIPLLQKYGSINAELANELNVSISHVQKLCVMYKINYHLYWSMKKRYKVDALFAIGLWNAFSDFDIVADILGVDVFSCKAIYKKKYGIVV